MGWGSLWNYKYWYGMTGLDLRLFPCFKLIMTNIPSICGIGSLSRLLDNQIAKIGGISNCNRLTHLSVAHNHLSEISGLDKLPIKYLDLVG